MAPPGRLAVWSGTTTITASAAGCNGPATTDHVVTVTPIPTVTLTTSDGDNNFCVGSSETFTAGGGITYEFFLNGTSDQAASGTTTYTPAALADGDVVTVTVTDANGCVATHAGLTMTEVPLPDTGDINSSTSLTRR